jgi:hypothetical protein
MISDDVASRQNHRQRVTFKSISAPSHGLVHAPVVRAAERGIRFGRHPRVLVGQIAELAPLPSVERLAERQPVDYMGDIRPLGILRLLRPVWKSTSELGYQPTRSRGRHRVDGVESPRHRADTACD